MSYPSKANFQTLEHTREVVNFIKEEDGYKDLAILGNLSSKHSKNAYYYLLESNNRYNMQYIDRFPQWIKSKPERGVLVICPSPYKKAREDIFRAVSKDWIIEDEIVPFADECLGYRLKASS